jgi:hypothetical protein
MPMHDRPLGRFSTTVAVSFTLVLALAACGSGDEDTAPPAEPTDLGPLLTVTIDGDEVSPNAEEIELGTGDKLLVEVDSDRAGELHVHSAPEQLVEFADGTTNSEIVVNTPGTVEVEDHDTGAVVALIEVR